MFNHRGRFFTGNHDGLGQLGKLTRSDNVTNLNIGHWTRFETWNHSAHGKGIKDLKEVTNRAQDLQNKLQAGGNFLNCETCVCWIYAVFPQRIYSVLVTFLYLSGMDKWISVQHGRPWRRLVTMVTMAMGWLLKWWLNWSNRTNHKSISMQCNNLQIPENNLKHINKNQFLSPQTFSNQERLFMIRQSHIHKNI